MRTYPSSEDVQGVTYTIIIPVVGYNFKTALTVHNFHFLAELPIVALQAMHTQHILHILPGTH